MRQHTKPYVITAHCGNEGWPEVRQTYYVTLVKVSSLPKSGFVPLGSEHCTNSQGCWEIKIIWVCT